MYQKGASAAASGAAGADTASPSTTRPSVSAGAASFTKRTCVYVVMMLPSLMVPAAIMAPMESSVPTMFFCVCWVVLLDCQPALVVERS